MGDVKRPPWARIVSLGSVIALSLGLVTVAYASPGLPIAKVDLNDSGVWVTNLSSVAVGRYNASAKALDGAVTPSEYNNFDVLQDDGNVFIRDLTGGSFEQIDPAAMIIIGSQVKLGPTTQMVLGGGTVAILDGDAGDLWVMPASSATGFTDDTTANPPAAEKLPKGAVTTVGTDGTAYLLDPTASTITTYPTDAAARSKTLKLSGLSTQNTYAMTVVGTTPVVFDRTGHALYLGTAKPISLDLTDSQASSLALQQPSEATTDVAYETTAGLVLQPLKGQVATRIPVPNNDTSKPAQPVHLNGCTYAVWSVTGAYVRQCAGDAQAEPSTVPKYSRGGDLQFRTNRGFIVLNQIQDGSVWQAGDQLVPTTTDWASVLTAPSAQNNDNTTQSDQQIDQSIKPDLSQPDHPPIANDDTFGVRAGRSTLLPVLENDISPDGYMLTASLVGSAPSIGTLSVVYSNSVFQIDVPDNTTGSATFQYQASDGRGGVSNIAAVTVNIVPSSQNNPPAQVRNTSLQVTSGKSVTYNILADWRDPDGDTVFLQNATAASPDDSVTFLADGTLTFTDGGKATGNKKITVTVADGQATTTGEVDVTVFPAGTARPPVTVSDMVSTSVDTPVTIHPLDNDSDPNGLPISLTSVTEAANCVVTPDMLANTIAATCSAAGTYYLVYTISNGQSQNVYGLIRLNVDPAPAGDEPPVAVPDTVLLHMGQTATVPVLNNDVNPMGWPLVVTSVSVPANAPVQATVINHGAVLVTPLQTFANAVTLTYQISNGIGYSDSTITVIPVPVPGQVSPPVTRDSTLKVRVGDVATANVLVNDSQPDGIPLELVPTLVQTPDASTGILVFTSGNAIRVQAGQTPGTYTVLYQVQVAQGSAEPATGRLTVTVTPSDPSHNQAPQPGDIEARTLAGQPITIPISLTGIDPDGDSCTLVGVASAPSQGAITAVTGNSITYDPTMSVTGSASFTYTVQDRLGAQAIGKVTVGIAPAQSSNDPPVAVTDVVQARPGRPMSVAVTANDYSPAGNSFSLVSGSAKSDSFAATTVNQNVTFTAPTTEGTYLATYEIQDSLQQSATGIISVQVSATAPLLPPNPQDDYVPMATGLSNTSVTVNVLANDSDPSGDVTQDTLTLLDSTNATVVGSNVQVTLVSQPQVIAYTLTNTQNNLTGRAYIWVPGLDTTPPQLKTGAPLVQVKAGQSVNLQLSDYVQVRSGRSPRLTSASKVTAWNGTGSAPSTTQLAFSAPLDYQGPASISFEVTDGATLNDDTGLTATLTVPITVLPPDPTQQPPTFSNSTVSVEPGASATVNLANFAKSPLGAKLTYSVTGGPALAGVKASLSGATLTVTADATTAVGGTDTISVSTSDGKNPAVSAQVDVTVVASTKPLPQALTDAANAQPGQTICVAATRNDLNPFGASAPLTIISVSVASGASSGVASVGCGGDAIGSVSITPNLSFIGQMTVSYTIQDATKQAARQASGVILVTVKGPPSAPTGIHVDSVGDKQVVLSWQPPTNDGGSPVTDYVVTGTPAYTLDCGTATICTLTGLTNTVTYTFTVTAKNAIGASPESVASAPATPDAVPDVMSPPIAQFGNSQLTFTWTPANTTGRSPVQHYELQISPIPANGQSQISTTGAGTSYTWTGLTNGTAYQVKACAVNAAPQACTEASMWSTASSPETPSAPPDPPAAPSLTVGTNLGTEAQVQICWNAPANNGAAITSYTVTASTGATATATPSGNAQTCTTMPMSNSTSAYTFTVKATNRAGTSSASGSTAVRVVGKPGVPTGLVLTDGDGSCGVNFTAPSLNGASASEVTYRWSASNGASGSFGGSTGGTATGLPNGSSNGRTGAYTISVWATTAFPGGSQTGDAATDTCQPYGPPKTPNGLTVTASGTTIKWNVPDPGGNGRPYSVQTNVNGAGWTGSSTSASGSPDVGYSKTLTVQARTCDDLTCSTEVSKSATTGAAPPPPAYCNYTINSTNVTVNFGSIAPNTTLYYNVGSGDKCVYDTAGGPTACVTNWNVYGNSYTNVGSWANGKPPSNVTFSFKGGTNLKCTKN